MKPFISLLIAIICLQSMAQKTEEQWFEELTDLSYEGDALTAYIGFGQFVEKYPQSSLVPRAVLNQGFLLRALGRDREAKAVFESVLQSSYNEYEPFGGIMEQYALYKNRSAKQLAEIALLEKEYDAVQKYINLFHREYPYKHFCGNELSADEIYTDVMYAKMHHGKGETKKAIQKLLPHMFYNGLAGNTEVITLLGEYLPLAFSKDQLNFFIRKGIQSFNVRKNGKNAQFTLLEVKISLNPYYLYELADDGAPDQTSFDRGALEALLKKHPVWSVYME